MTDVTAAPRHGADRWGKRQFGGVGWLMTNFTILYASAALLILSALVTLGVIVIWALGERRIRFEPRVRQVGFTAANDETQVRAYALVREPAL